MSKKAISGSVKKVIANNKRAYFDYFIEEELEAGIVLTGTEVKSLRNGKASIVEAHVEEIKGELYVTGLFIPEYDQAHQFNHHPRRPRKLLLRAREIRRIMGLIQRKGYTSVPLQLYFNHKNKAKVEIGLAKGKKLHDKRETIKQRDWEREKSRTIKESK